MNLNRSRLWVETTNRFLPMYAVACSCPYVTVDLSSLETGFFTRHDNVAVHPNEEFVTFPQFPTSRSGNSDVSRRTFLVFISFFIHGTFVTNTTHGWLQDFSKIFRTVIFSYYLSDLSVAFFFNQLFLSCFSAQL